MRCARLGLVTMWMFGVLAAGAGCSASSDGGPGEITIALAGQSSSGVSYRLRNATISVDGPVSQVWHTEDDPARDTLSADVPAGDYSVRLDDGWQLERRDGMTTTAVGAEFVSDNPQRFSVTASQRALVRLQFRVDGDGVDLAQGYDISLGVQDSPLSLAIACTDNSTEKASISVFRARASGDLAPLRRISGTRSAVGSPFSVVVAGGQLIAADLGAPAINFYPVDGNGDVAPSRRIAGSMTHLVGPVALAVAGGEIYVGQNDGSILIFPLTASGNIAPTRSITALRYAGGLAIDNGELYVTDYFGTIAVFPLTASGNAVPTRTITPTDTSCLNGIAVRDGEIFVGTTCLAGVYVYPKLANGSMAALRAIVGPDTGISGAEGVVRFGQDIYVATNLDSVLVFPANASGNVRPVRAIGGSQSMFGFAYGVTVF